MNQREFRDTLRQSADELPTLPGLADRIIEAAAELPAPATARGRARQWPARWPMLLSAAAILAVIGGVIALLQSPVSGKRATGTSVSPLPSTTAVPSTAPSHTGARRATHASSPVTRYSPPAGGGVLLPRGSSSTPSGSTTPTSPSTTPSSSPSSTGPAPCTAQDLDTASGNAGTENQNYAQSTSDMILFAGPPTHVGDTLWECAMTTGPVSIVVQDANGSTLATARSTIGATFNYDPPGDDWSYNVQITSPTCPGQSPQPLTFKITMPWGSVYTAQTTAFVTCGQLTTTPLQPGRMSSH